MGGPFSSGTGRPILISPRQAAGPPVVRTASSPPSPWTWVNVLPRSLPAGAWATPRPRRTDRLVSAPFR
ncbi:hypothetical protein ACFQYP_43470 [Nonomuraea antimicrobica]